MIIEINENYLEQEVVVNGKTFKITRELKEIAWTCINCGNKNYDNDAYIEENFVECDKCGELFAIDLYSDGDILKIQHKDEYEPL